MQFLHFYISTLPGKSQILRVTFFLSVILGMVFYAIGVFIAFQATSKITGITRWVFTGITRWVFP